MLMPPSKLLLQKILKNRTLNLETVKKNYGNFIMIGTSDQKDFNEVLKSKLFRPQQLMSSFVPRLIRPMGRKTMIIKQKDIYSEIKDQTNGKIKIGKIMLSAYNGKNLVYNILPEYNETFNLVYKMKKNIQLQTYMIKYFEELASQRAEEINYEKSYLVFPLNKYIENFKKKVYVSLDAVDPMILFLKSLLKGWGSISNFSRYDKIIFFNPRANAMVVIDPKNFDSEKSFTDLFIKINRLNAFNNGEDSLTDDVVEESDEKLDKEEEIENTKEQIKEIVLKKVAKTLGANKLNDFEAADKDEKDLILSIDKRIDSYLLDKNNLDKPFEELVSTIEQDQEVKVKALKYVETKKIAEQKLTQLSRNLEKEVEVLGSIQNLESLESTVEPDVFESDIVDESIKQSTLSNFDEEYNKKQAMKDLTSIISSFSSSNYLPMTVDSFEMVDTSDDFKQVDTIYVKYKTDEGKRLSFVLDIPKIVDKRYFYLNGNKKVLTKQLFRLPIVKTKPDRVEITTNFNKITIERSGGKISRKNAYILKLLEDYKLNPNFKIEYGANGISNSNFTNDFEYEELSEEITSIETIKYKIYFNREEMQKEIDLLDIPEDFVKKEMTPLGFDKLGGSMIFIKDEAVFSVKIEGEKTINKISDSLFNFLYTNILERTDSDKLPQIGKSFVYTKMSILGTTYPVFAVLGMLNGITDILKRYKVDHKFSEKKLPRDGEFVEVKFRDKYLYYKDVTKNTLLLNVLYMMNTEEYDYSDFDLDQPYLDFFIEKLDQPIYIKNTLKINTNIIIDPITKSVLSDLKMPTDIIDLLLLANTMLMNNSYRPQNDVRNYRIRGNEIVYAMMYYIVADAYLRYQRARLNGRDAASLDIPKNVLISKLSMEPNVNDHSTLNPVLEMESIAQISAKGWRGINLDDAFTLEVRAYDESMIGFISPNSTPQGNAGVSRALSYNPKITSIRGYIPDVQRDLLNAANMLSPTEMLSSFTSTQADPMRQSMQIGQTKHTMPVVKTHKQLIGSGINKIMAFMISDDFAFKAKEDGYVKKIDEENQLAILEYKSGKQDAIDLSEVLVKNSNSGFFIKQKFLIVFKEGEKFKARDVIAYNPSFFSGKGKDIDYQPGVLAKVAITPGDFAYEDSTIISSSIAKKAASLVTMMKPVSLGPNTVVHKIASVGQKIKAGEEILNFTTSFEDPSTTEFLAALSKSLGDEIAESIGNETIKSKYSGTVVNIKIYYNMPLEELNESLQKLIKKYKAKVQKRKNALEGIKTSSVHIPPLEQQKNDKVGVEEYEGVLIEFYVEYFDEMGEGDKLVYSTALKGVISQTIDESEAPLSEYRKDENIEAIITPTGIISRMTADIYSMLYGNKVLVELGKQIKEIMEE
jgi:hypothetical protein